MVFTYKLWEGLGFESQSGWQNILYKIIIYHLFIPDELILLYICIINNYSSVYAINVEEETII